MNKYKRRRITAYIIIILMILGIKSFAKEEMQIESYIVKKGDTLWSIAQEYNEDDYILDYMDDLKNLNKSSLEQLSIGQEVKVIVKGGK